MPPAKLDATHPAMDSPVMRSHEVSPDCSSHRDPEAADCADANADCKLASNASLPMLRRVTWDVAERIAVIIVFSCASDVAHEAAQGRASPCSVDSVESCQSNQALVVPHYCRR